MNRNALSGETRRYIYRRCNNQLSKWRACSDIVALKQ